MSPCLYITMSSRIGLVETGNALQKETECNPFSLTHNIRVNLTSQTSRPLSRETLLLKDIPRFYIKKTKKKSGICAILIPTVMLLTKLYIVNKTSDELFESNKITNVFH